MKYKIQTYDGIKEVDGRGVRFQTPQWLSRYDFFVHESIGGAVLNDYKYRLSEVSLGSSVPESQSDSETKTIRLGKQSLMKCGEKKFKEAMKRAIAEIKESHNA